MHIGRYSFIYIYNFFANSSSMNIKYKCGSFLVFFFTFLGFTVHFLFMGAILWYCILCSKIREYFLYLYFYPFPLGISVFVFSFCICLALLPTVIYKVFKILPSWGETVSGFSWMLWCRFDLWTKGNGLVTRGSPNGFILKSKSRTSDSLPSSVIG